MTTSRLKINNNNNNMKSSRNITLMVIFQCVLNTLGNLTNNFNQNNLNN